MSDSESPKPTEEVLHHHHHHPRIPPSLLAWCPAIMPPWCSLLPAAWCNPAALRSAFPGSVFSSVTYGEQGYLVRDHAVTSISVNRRPWSRARTFWFSFLPRKRPFAVDVEPALFRKRVFPALIYDAIRRDDLTIISAHDYVKWRFRYNAIEKLINTFASNVRGEIWFKYAIIFDADN